MKDIKSRVNNCIQLTTDGHKAYLVAVPDAFGSKIDMLYLSNFTAIHKAQPQANVNTAPAIARVLKRKGYYV